MGYGDYYFLNVVLQEAIILAFLGYMPGLLMSIFLYSLTASATSLPLIMTFTKIVTVFVFTVFMCFFSGVIAMNKLKEADPADCF
jgi:putative ABC transport system permease protein